MKMVNIWSNEKKTEVCFSIILSVKLNFKILIMCTYGSLNVFLNDLCPQLVI